MRWQRYAAVCQRRCLPYCLGTHVLHVLQVLQESVCSYHQTSKHMALAAAAKQQSTSSSPLMVMDTLPESSLLLLGRRLVASPAPSAEGLHQQLRQQWLRLAARSEACSALCDEECALQVQMHAKITTIQLQVLIMRRSILQCNSFGQSLVSATCAWLLTS